MHVGATLKLLRLDAGLGLRDLARRIGVSSAYLSRVEHGIDPPPTSERLAAIARELEVPPALLVDAASRLSPIVTSYVETVPGAGALFLDIARRRLTGSQLARIHDFIAEQFPLPRAADGDLPALEPLLEPERVILKLRCSDLFDALDLAAVRLAPSTPIGAAELASLLRACESSASSVVGGGVAIPRAYVEGAATCAALVTLAQPIPVETPDGQPLRYLIVLVGSRSPAMLTLLTHVARLSAHGLGDALSQLDDPRWVLERLRDLEAVR